MELIIIGIVSALNLIVIVHKFKKGRVQDGIFDSILFALMTMLFSGSYAGMVVAMIASFIVSIYLYANPPKFFSNFLSSQNVKDDLKKLMEPPKSKGRSKISDIHFD